VEELHSRSGIMTVNVLANTDSTPAFSNVENVLPICDSREMEDNSGIRVKFISDLLHFRLLMGCTRDRISLLSKKLKIKIYRTIILPVVKRSVT
jgi:hypothetical protein